MTGGKKKRDLECCKNESGTTGKKRKVSKKKTPNKSSRPCILYHTETNDSAPHQAVCTEVKGQVRGERDKQERSGCRGGGRN